MNEEYLIKKLYHDKTCENIEDFTDKLLNLHNISNVSKMSKDDKYCYAYTIYSIKFTEENLKFLKSIKEKNEIINEMIDTDIEYLEYNNRLQHELNCC